MSSNYIFQVVKEKILDGKSLEALEMLKGSFPLLLKEFPKLEFLLNVQHFIELLIAKDQTGAITFAKNVLGSIKNEGFITLKENNIEEISLDVPKQFILLLKQILGSLWTFML